MSGNAERDLYSLAHGGFDGYTRFRDTPEQVWACPVEGCGLTVLATRQPRPCEDHPFDDMVSEGQR